MQSIAGHIKDELEKLEAIMLEAEQQFNCWLNQSHPAQYKSACNLLHYLSLRNKDIRELQEVLHENGLSSLASSESHIRSQLLAVLKQLNPSVDKEAVINYKASKELLKSKSVDLFGNSSMYNVPYIMVTLDSSHADDYPSVKNLLQSGMNIARINCSHDDESIWMRMIEHVKKASIVTGLPCKIYMDLPGAKIRTFLPQKKGKKTKLKVKKGQTIYLSEKYLANKKKRIIGCTLSGITTQLKKGERILIDDGMIETKVTGLDKDIVQLQISRVSSNKPFIRNEKGINFPDTQLMNSSLTEFDLKCLPLIEEHADMVGYSFLHNAKNVLELQEAMVNKKLPIILKIETPEAVKNLPELLLQGMSEKLFGVMIARGDLAVEIGFERMSEIQEEILWICEAGHVPVIWATQVLESLNKSGIATRSEVTDAAHAIMAECVLINKGSHTIEVIEALKDILYRSGGHRIKKRYISRPLSIASRFMAGTGITPHTTFTSKRSMALQEQLC